MEDLRHLEFLALNSKEIVEKQVESFRTLHTYAGTIIGAKALFIPIFLNNFTGTAQFIQWASLLPIGMFIAVILLMLSLFRSKPLDQAFRALKYKELMNKSYTDILIYEIEANTQSYNRNIVITTQTTKRYSIGITLITTALIISISLVMANKLITIEKAPTKVQVVNNPKAPIKVTNTDKKPPNSK
jgi:hypothetical protein